MDLNKPQSLYEKLTEYADAGYLPMHMPGAKGKNNLVSLPDPYRIDITEIDGFDNMHHPESGEVLDLEMKRAARMFGADHTLLSVNGSTGAILAAISGAVPKRSKVLVARNCHISVQNAIILRELTPVWLYPEVLHKKAGIYGAYGDKSIRNALECEQDIAAVIITSPTYEGVVSDIRSIADICHAHGAKLIVDEAHGAHFPFSETLPESAVSQGADLVIQSLHKTLPALTSTALLHVNSERFAGQNGWEKVDYENVKRFSDIYQTSSPSYVLMASISGCLNLLEKRSGELFETYERNVRVLRKRLRNLKKIFLLSTDDWGKLVLIVDNASALHDYLLNEHQIQIEMTSLHYVILMTSIADSVADYERLAGALERYDFMRMQADNDAHSHKNEESVKSGALNFDVAQFMVECKSEIRCIPAEAFEAPCEEVALEAAVGRVAGEEICMYPPGISVVCPGEIITEESVALIQKACERLHVYGISEGKVKCLK